MGQKTVLCLVLPTSSRSPSVRSSIMIRVKRLLVSFETLLLTEWTSVCSHVRSPGPRVRHYLGSYRDGEVVGVGRRD